MRPSQVTHQGCLYYHCAFTAPAKHPLEMHTYICSICSRYLYMYACSWVPFRVSDCWDAVTSLVCVQCECVVVCSAPCHAFCSVYMFHLWIKKKKKNYHISFYVIVTYSRCWFCYRTPNCTPVLLWILYWSPDQVGYDHELYLWGASGGWWEIWNTGTG